MRSLNVRKSGFANKGGGLLVRHRVGIDYQVEGEGVIEFLAEVGLEVALSALVFPLNRGQRCVPAQATGLPQVFDSFFERADEPDVEGVWQGAGDDVRTAANQDGVSCSRDAQNSLGGLLNQAPGSRMNSKKFFECIGEVGDAVFRHVTRQASGQVMVLQDLLDKVTVKDAPGWAIRSASGLEETGEIIGDAVSARSGLAGDSNS